MNTTEERTLEQVLEGLMASRGIEDLEEFHARLMETEWAHIPARGRHTGKPVPLEEFKAHVRAEIPRIYPEFLNGVCAVLDTSDEETQAIIHAYLWQRGNSSKA
jgi:hypothetical protein